MSAKKTEQVNMRLAPDVLEQVKSAAEEQGQTISKWIEDALRAHLVATKRLREGRMLLIAEEPGEYKRAKTGRKAPKKRGTKKWTGKRKTDPQAG